MAVTYLSRAQWGAGSLGSGRRAPHTQFVGLVVHHTVAVMPDWDRDGQRYGDMDDIKRYMRWLQHARPDLGDEVPYCLAPETRVLTSDLRWQALGDIVPGDELLAFTDLPGPRWSLSTVERAGAARLPCFRVVLEDGTEFVASGRHRWLTMQQASFIWRTTEQLARPNRRAPTKVVKLVDTWRDDVGRDAGYLAGVFDADGHFTLREQTNGQRRQWTMSLQLSQLDNEVLAAAGKLLAERGMQFSVYGKAPDRQDVRVLSLRGGPAAKLRFLGETRPPRLLRRWRNQAAGQVMGRIAKNELVPVEHIEFIGPQDVVTLQTSTGTLIAEGFGHHNSFVVFEAAADGDCVVAEGRGFGVTGAHTSGYNSSRYGVALAGNSSTRPVTEGILSGYRWVGRRLADPAGAEPTLGHRDVKATECPGSSLYAALPQLQPPFEEEDMPLTSDDLERIEAKVRQVLNEGTGKGQRSWADTSKATLSQVQHNTVLLNSLRANLRVANIDEAELAAAIAPLIAANTESLSDDELDTVVKAVNDEQQRRAV